MEILNHLATIPEPSFLAHQHFLHSSLLSYQFLISQVQWEVISDTRMCFIVTSAMMKEHIFKFFPFVSEYDFSLIFFFLSLDTLWGPANRADQNKWAYHYYCQFSKALSRAWSMGPNEAQPINSPTFTRLEEFTRVSGKDYK